MKKDYTHIGFVLDRSGSMNKVKSDTIGGFNNFVNDQKKIEKPATMSFYQFDDRFEPNYLFRPVNEVGDLNDNTYKPRGWTRLLDAVGRAIVETGEHLNKLKEEDRPEKIVMVIQTDGQENDSKEFSYEDISNLIKKQVEIYKWEFVFLGAKLEAVKEAQKWGIRGQNVMCYADNGPGTTSAFHAVSKNLASYRAGGKADMSFEKADREEQEKAGLEKLGDPAMRSARPITTKNQSWSKKFEGKKD